MFELGLADFDGFWIFEFLEIKGWDSGRDS